MKQKIINTLKQLTNHTYLEIVPRGNSAILSVIKLVKKKLLIPEEGGWLTYKDYPEKLNINHGFVKCENAVINLEDLKQKVKDADVFLYQNPGGYFAEQPVKEIYQICKENNCLVVLDTSGSIGTKLCDGNYADIILASFGKWKLVEARVGGFISCKDKTLFNKLELEHLNDENSLNIIEKNLNLLPERIKFLTEARSKIINDLQDFNILNKDHLGFVVVIEFNDEEKDQIINYCKKNNLEYTLCPRYIRVNKKAISIEIKRLGQ
jgi:hypothetical protein